MFTRKLGGIALAGLLLGLAWATASPTGKTFARVKLYAVSLLTDPGPKGLRLGRFYMGRRLEVLDDESNRHFVKVRGDGREGWVFRRYLSFDPCTEETYPAEKCGVSSEFLASDRNGNGVPDYIEIVQVARSFIGRYFDDFNKIGGPGGPYQTAVEESRWATKYLAGGLEAAGPHPSESNEGPGEIAIPDSFGIADGTHWRWSMDGKDNNGDGRADEPLEEVMVCVDLCTASYEQAGYPITKMMLDGAGIHDQVQWTPGIWVSEHKPYYTRSLDNVVPFIRHSSMFKYFPEPAIHEVGVRPNTAFRPGDMIFFGLTKDLGTSKFHLCHSGIVSEVDPETGLPLTMITCVVPRVMEFQDIPHFYDRFTILGHARPNYEGSTE